MNVGQLIKTELATLISDVENSPLAGQIRTYIDGEIARIEAEIKSYVDEVIAKAFQPNITTGSGQQG